MVRKVGRGSIVSLIGGATRLWELPRVRLAVAVVAFAAGTVVTCLIAHPRIFTGFASYDDEGYMLTALKGFVNHGHLYDRVFTQYGPFYYEAWGAVFSIFGIPVTHDGGRAVTLVAWVLSSLLVGFASWRITSSILLGLGTQILVFGALVTLVNEPMHPGGIICLLLATIVTISCFVRDRVSPYAMAVLGGAVAALVLVKINVGSFALASLLLACVVSYPVLGSRRWLRPAVEVGFVALPVVLMLGKFGESWVRQYAAHVALAALAAVVVLRARERERRPAEELGWLLGGFAALAVVVCLAIVAAGTSPGSLVDGVIRQPLRQAGAFTLPLELPKRFYSLDLIALGGAFAYSYVTRKRRGSPTGAWLATTSLLSIVVGLAMAQSVAGKSLPFDLTALLGNPLSMLAFCWVALIAPSPGAPPALAFARLLLPLLAVLQALHAYPVAGSQTLWSSFLLIPVGAICVAEGARGLHAALAAGAERRALVALAGIGAVALIWSVGNAALREPLQEARVAYDGSASLGLPGSERVHVGQPEAELYGEISAAIERDCPAFVMLPGMDSFYLWTEQEPPTGYNATGWPTLFDEEHQRRVIADTRSIAGLCLLENVPLVEYWTGGTAPSGPLVRYLHRGFRLIASFGDYRLLKREEGSRA